MPEHRSFRSSSLINLPKFSKLLNFRQKLFNYFSMKCKQYLINLSLHITFLRYAIFTGKSFNYSPWKKEQFIFQINVQFLSTSSREIFMQKFLITPQLKIHLVFQIISQRPISIDIVIFSRQRFFMLLLNIQFLIS